MDKERIMTRLDSFMDAIESTMETTGGFISEQTPLVIHEYLLFLYYQYLALTIVYCSVAIICAGIAWKLSKHIRSESYNYCNDDLSVPLTLALSVLSAGFVVAAAYNSVMLTKVTIAPRIVLLEKVSSIVRGQ